MDKKKFAAIVLAAGTGSRMNSDIPKQYMKLGGYPILYYSLKAFEESDVESVILVCGELDIAYCRREIVERYGFRKVCAVVAGGKERYLSVYEGLKVVPQVDYVLIHDGARPLIDRESICRSMDMVEKEKACVLAIPVKDTIKVSDDAGYALETPERSRLWAIQTPQSFSYNLIMEAYDRLFHAQLVGEILPPMTDDAMIVEQMSGHKVKLIQGKNENIKITTPEDLGVAEMFLKKIKNLVDTKD